jgi:hypothetical protein
MRCRGWSTGVGIVYSHCTFITIYAAHRSIYLRLFYPSCMIVGNEYLHTVEEPMTRKGKHHGEESWAARNPPGP